MLCWLMQCIHRDIISWHTCDSWTIGSWSQDYGTVLQHLGQVFALLSGHLNLKPDCQVCTR